MIEAPAIRDSLRGLYESRERGDLPERRFERLQADAIVDLCRAAARERLVAGEGIEAEHHVVHAHMRVNQSVLQETEQECVSLFLTPTRLLRLRFLVSPGRPPSCDERDGARWDDVEVGGVIGLEARRAVRTGEAAAGAVVFAAAALFHPLLEVTGLLMAALGLLGILHAVLLPTRWIDVETMPPAPRAEDVIRVFAIHKKSARGLVRLLKGAVRRPG
ncbi:MAG: hypothetical protein HY897_04935 [Deltaproteobacteria bacterium]|nr:hypothetical protein [Deltaproteobacteria bacterium]